jgi:hypothetical protein
MSDSSGYFVRRVAALVLVIGLAGGIGYWWRTRPNGSGTAANESGSVASETVPSATISLLTSGSKQKLFRQLADDFSRLHPGAKIDVRAMESRDGLQYLLNGASDADRPDLYSPSDPRLATSLDSNWRKAHGGKSLIASSSADQDFIFAETPVVFLTTAQKSAELESVLTADHPWEKIRERVAQGEGFSWGKLRFSFANPLGSASGMTVLGMALADATNSKKSVSAFLKELSPGIVYDDAARGGSSQLFEAFVSELVSQGSSPRDFIVTYESNALQAAREHPELGLRVIYPAQTPYAMHRVCLLESMGREPERRELSLAFLRYLKSAKAQQKVIESRLHPRFVADALPAGLSDVADSGFHAVKTRAPLPRYNDVMNALQLWNERIAPQLSE